MTDTNLLGVAEIADLYSVSKVTAGTWSRQRDFPPPIARLKMGPVWDKEQVINWRTPKPSGQAVSLECAWCGSLEFTGKPIGAEWDPDTPLTLARVSAKCNKCLRVTGAIIFWNFETGEIRFSTYCKEDK